MTQYRELEPIVDGRWGGEHPEQATAICMERVRRHLGLDSVSLPKPEPPAKRKPKAKPGHAPPLGADGVPMVKAVDLAKRMGLNRRRIGNWVYKGHVQGTSRQEGCRKRMYVSETDVRRCLATQKNAAGGRPRQER